MDDQQARVLIVDDEPFNIKVLADVLKADYKTIVAKDGEQALKRIESDNPPDLILLDVMMPGMSGHEVCAKLKADPATRDIPVIFVTAMTDEADEAKGLELGAVDYITKPISPDIVKARVHAHIELVNSRKVLASQNEELKMSIKTREDMESIMRHDLKGPLNAIIGFPQLMIDMDMVGDDEKEMLQQVLDSGYRMLDMINQSLDMVKMENGTYTLFPDTVDVKKVIDGVLSECKTIAEAHGSKISVKGAEGQKSIGEELLTHSLLANLTKNAIEAAPRDTAIEISVAAGSDVAISIHNLGAVPEEIRAKFFDKYATAGKRSGTGLGTYSARMMAETQHGSIELDTSEEGATTITVHLPVV